MESILNYERKVENDFYGLLGCPETATTEQIIAEFRTRALQSHPDKTNETHLVADFQHLMEARTVLTDPEMRRLYDEYRHAGVAMSWKDWFKLSKTMRSSLHFRGSAMSSNRAIESQPQHFSSKDTVGSLSQTSEDRLEMKTRKAIDDCWKTGATELELIDKGITSLDKYEQFGQLDRLSKLSLAHNKLIRLPASIRGLTSLEVVNAFDNHITEVGEEIIQLASLRIIILGINCLTHLPSSISMLQNLQVLDLSYNFLTNESIPDAFWQLKNLRSLYLADNDLTNLPPEISQLEKLEILNVRGNELICLPSQVGHLTRLREFNAQGNRLTLLPPEFGDLNFVGPSASLQLEFNPWLPVLEKRMKSGLASFFEYLRNSEYRRSYERFLAQLPTQPPQRRIDKVSKKKLSEFLASKQAK